ncbi:uncharacterized protein LOC120277686 [Dioscorea cayenensis subsp. rotundata]|uniref:Uncharacterized protein LOC120277686 n=1 Tax=Dioscorea cayennensis subsp. rotundata TaxID=55577 RepID=A0AB40CN26_DIOCR|nr:uncharacterized protein LOC120277686 [Dioscorea cayenensis subsp. rotundata]
MPSYAKFLKDILSNKRRLEEHETVALTEECSALIQNKLPPKLKDPGSFLIPCEIRAASFEKALCNLGASVSFMPLSVCKKLDMGELKPETISLQLADRSVKHPISILEDIPIKVGKFFVPADFVVLKMEEDTQIPIILGRPFLETTGALIDVKNGKLSLIVGEEKVEFDLANSVKRSFVESSCCRVDDPLHLCLVHDELEDNEDGESEDCAQLSLPKELLRHQQARTKILEPVSTVHNPEKL